MSGSPFGPAFDVQYGPFQYTASTIIQDALEMLRVYAPGETFTLPDGARGRQVLNDMLDSWSNESLFCVTWLTQTFTMIPNVSAYTVGPSAAIPGARPLRISNVSGSAYILDAAGNKYMMDVLDQMQWNLVTTAVANSDLPDTIFYDPQFPLGVINIWPTPNNSYTCSFLSLKQLDGFHTLDSPFSLPPGYKLALTTNLAIALKPYFRDAQLDPIIIQRAMESKAAVKRNNMRPQVAVLDPELVSRGSSTYNIYTDRGTGRN